MRTGERHTAWATEEVFSVPIGRIGSLFFEIVCRRWAGADEIEHHSLILCHPEMTNTLWLGEKAARWARF
jgi:hypothetical protein